jgi:RecB family exonuclease
MSGSSLDSLIACPLKWFLDKEVKAQVSRGAATAFGSIVHAVAEYVAKGEVPDNIEAMQALINSSWRNVVYESPWQSTSELAHAREAAARFLRYHHQSDRVYLEAEQLLTTEVSVTTPAGEADTILLTGFVDRVERDPSGRLVAIDLKNMKTAVPAGKIPEHGQLGVYQLLLQDRQSSAVVESKEKAASVDPGIGAALVQLRVEDTTGMPKVQGQPAIDFGQSPTWIEQRLGEAAEIIRNESFIPIPGEECRFCSYHSVCPTKSGTVFQPLPPTDENLVDLAAGDLHD